MKKKIFIIFFVTIIFLLAKTTLAATMTLVSPQGSVGLNEQFYVDLFLDPEGVSINGIEGNITFPDEYLSFLRSEEGKSMVSLWIEPPKLINNIIKFTGIIPNGFDGVIDPFNQRHKLPGLIIRFVFEAIRPGQISITTPSFIISLNDGLGTTQHIPAITTLINIRNESNNVVYKGNKESSPELEAYIIKDASLFNNRYSLIFKAKDEGSGIKKVMIKEGNKDWVEIHSPYLLEDQTRHSIIALQAINYNGSSMIITINPIDFKFGIIDYLVLFIISSILFFVIKKIYVDKNKK